MKGVSELHRSHYCGDVHSVSRWLAEVEVKNRFSIGDQMEVIHPSGNEVMTLERCSHGWRAG